jgi:putative ABC transport system permease protein
MSKLALEWANFRESLQMALSSVKTSKLRSLLTLLGIAVGVFSIISVMTAVGVLKNSIEEGMMQLGANTFQVQKFPAFQTGPGDRHRFRNRKDITYEQAVAVREKATLASAVGIEMWRFGLVFVWNGQKTNPNISIGGENLDGLVTNDWTVEIGRSFSQQDLDEGRKVMILGKALAEKLFPPSINPLGESVRADGSVYQVIGVFESKGGALGGNQDNFGAIPITTYMHKYGKATRSVNIMVKAINRESMEDAIEQVRLILRTARKVPPGAEDDFAWFSNDSLIKQFDEFTLYLRLGVMLISFIALLAAGVGIMNIMLVSVNERIKEIGIRKAIGARKRDIMQQFIIEAVTLSSVGGVIGMVLGFIMAGLVSLAIRLPATVSWWSVLLGFGFSAAVGIFFGWYPARRAAELDPIEALRYE